MRLTDAFVRNLKFDGKKVRHFDDALPNFGVRVYKSGVSFMVLIGNNRKQITLGKYPTMSLKEARTVALELLHTKDRRSSEISTSEALGDFLSHSEANNKPRTARDYKRLLNRHFPQGSLQTLRRGDILNKLDGLKHVPGERSHATAAFQVFLNWCVHNGYLDINPIAGLRNQGKVQKRDRILTDEEIKAVWEHLGDDRFDRTVRILMLTGLRRGEVQHIVVNDDTATIPAEFTKNGHEHTFPLGPLSKQYVEPITFNGWGKSKSRLDKTCGVTDYTLHDLRRTYASNHARLGTPIHVTEKLINHISGVFAGITGVYQKYEYVDEMREACQKYEEWLISILPRGKGKP